MEILKDDKETKLIGRLDQNDKQMVGRALPSDAPDVGQAIVDDELERRREAAEKLGKKDDETERYKALMNVITEKVELERAQIVGVLMGYAEDCEERADELDKSAHTERKRLRKAGRVAEAEERNHMQIARCAAFRVRSAIAADLAMKVDTGWGRNPDGTVMEHKVDEDATLAKVAEFRAKLKQS